MRLFIRTSVIGGVLFLIPLAVAVAVIGKAFQVLKVVATWLSGMIPGGIVVGDADVEVLAIAIMLACCAAAGLLARSSRGRTAYEAIDALLLQVIPGYAWFHVYTDGVGDAEASHELSPVLVRFDDQYQLGLEAERTDDGLVAVFVPEAPNPRFGALSYVTADRVKPLDASFSAIAKVCKDLGRGSRAVLGSMLLVVAVASIPTAAAAAPCESLAELALPSATITSAQVVAAGAFVPPAVAESSPGALPRERELSADLPAFCRVAATLRPSSDSDVKIEVWMPSSGWNGKFLGVGNGGWAGAINYPGLRDGLRRGYAVASTDTGHPGSGGDASFAMGHPEKLIDFGYRAVHEMTGVAKAVVAGFYEQPPGLSYWAGCSGGGLQALSEAQRFPDDYDGIIAGAPANYATHLLVGQLWAAHATMIEPESALSGPKLELLNEGVISACDALDGAEDGVLENPARCDFDPQVLRCEDGDAPACLTAAQVTAARKVYAPATNPRTGQIIFPGLARGSERGWEGVLGGPEPISIATTFFKYVVFEDPDWDFRTLDFDRDVVRADSFDGTLNAVDPNLQPFIESGGKLILYHGWNDQLISPYNSINYYESVVETLGADETESSIRLFMAPGMAHCGGGIGPSEVDWLGELERWVEDGEAPNRIVATRSQQGVIDRTRPLCPYPLVARYRGTGSTDSATNFECIAFDSER